MKRVFLVLLLNVLCLAAVCGAAPPPLGATFPATVERVIDGDTAIVSVTLQLRVRFEDCYVPDKMPRINARAKKDLAQYAEKMPCIVHLEARDLTKAAHQAMLAPVLTLERFVGDIWLKENSRYSLSEWQVKRGNASSTHDGKLGE